MPHIRHRFSSDQGSKITSCRVGPYKVTSAVDLMESAGNRKHENQTKDIDALPAALSYLASHKSLGEGGLRAIKEVSPSVLLCLRLVRSTCQEVTTTHMHLI